MTEDAHMGVKNVMEQVVMNVMRRQWENLNMPCSCSVCQDDVLALTLNAIPPRYASNDKGRLIIKVNMMEEQMIADVLRELARASRIVSRKPSHNL
jgi:competence protein ComFB